MLDSRVIDNFLSENLQPILAAKNNSSNEELNETLRILKKHTDSIKKFLTSSDEQCSNENQYIDSGEREITKCGLSLREIQKYSRQLILPEMRVTGQLKLKTASVLIVGAGGLGCPAALYLAASGIGRIGIIDGDTIDMSNLHRQVAHKEINIGKSKADSLCQAINNLNIDVKTVSYKCLLSSENALDILNDNYDVVLDATDNPATRYLINDACQLSGKPLVSGSALRWEGQLTVYNYPPGEGPTYRCLFPDPPSPDTVTNCSDGGVIGVITGVIGCLQALETIKIIVNCKEGVNSDTNQNLKTLSGAMLIFDAMTCRFRHIKLRPRRKEANTVVKELIDYKLFCGSEMNDKAINRSDRYNQHKKSRISVEEYHKMVSMKTPHILIDVRTEPEVEICSLNGSINIPLEEIQSQDLLDKNLSLIQEQIHSLDAFQEIKSWNETHIVLVCRRGNDSQIAKHIFEEKFCSKICNTKSVNNQNLKLVICDIIGGLEAWANRIDTKFPKY